MATDNEKAIDVLCKQIKYAVNTLIAKANFNREYIGVIEKVITNQKFAVRFNDATYEINTKNKLNLKVHDNVHVVIPNNNIRNRYILEDVIVTGMSLKI